MTRSWPEGIGSGSPAEEPEIDAHVVEALRALDPCSADEGYWSRFRAAVLRRAAPELARRRLAARVTVAEVLASWARTVVPTALLAAAIAGVVLMKAREAPAPRPVDVEEMLVAGMEGSSIPATLGGEGTDAGAVTFAMGTF